MLARLFYGMACNHQLPAVLHRISRRTSTPGPATVAAGGLVMATTLLFPFERLLPLANLLTLGLLSWQYPQTTPMLRRPLWESPRWIFEAARAPGMIWINAMEERRRHLPAAWASYSATTMRRSRYFRALIDRLTTTLAAITKEASDKPRE